MDWWIYVLCAVGVGVILGFWSWVALSIVRLNLRVAVVEQQLKITDEQFNRGTEKFDLVFHKLDQLSADVARILGILNGGHTGG